ncbi:MAG: hypothetical protein LBF40_00260 [Deltaproteobacteria bacterium]|jgi:hypothetical protein|nr:hypothetical protein [Deltaproteobacteria bacterium]
MAKNIKIGESKHTHTNPLCKAAEHCCWYETKESSNECSHRNELICHLRREEVFGEKQQIADIGKEAVVPA